MPEIVPVDKTKAVADLTGIRDMLQQFTSRKGSERITWALVGYLQDKERKDLTAKLEQEKMDTPGRLPVVNPSQVKQITPEEEQEILKAVNGMVIQNTEAVVRQKIKAEFDRYMDSPVPELTPVRDAKGKTIKTFGDYFDHAAALVDTLHAGGSISPGDGLFLKEFSHRMQYLGSPLQALLLPPQFETLPGKEDKERGSPVRMLFNQVEGIKRATKKFGGLEQAMLDYEFRKSEHIEKERAKLRAMGLVVKDDKIAILPLTLPPTREAVFNAIARENWQVKTDSDAFVDPFGGQHPPTSVMVVPKMEVPSGLITHEPFKDVVKKEGLAALKITELPSEPWNRDLVVFPEPEYSLEVPRAVYDAKISTIADDALQALQKGLQNAQVFEANCSVTHGMCSVRDDQIDAVKTRLDALKIPCDVDTSLTYITMPVDTFNTGLMQNALKPFMDKLRAFPKRGDALLTITSKDALNPDEFKQLSKALKATRKADYTLVQETVLTFKPEVYDQQVTPIINLKLGSTLPDKVREQALAAMRPEAGAQPQAPVDPMQALNKLKTSLAISQNGSAIG